MRIGVTKRRKAGRPTLMGIRWSQRQKKKSVNGKSLLTSDFNRVYRRPVYKLHLLAGRVKTWTNTRWGKWGSKPHGYESITDLIGGGRDRSRLCNN